MIARLRRERPIDTGGQCTGAYCEDFCLSTGGRWLSHAEVALLAATHPEGSIIRLATPMREDERGYGRFTCSQLELGTKRCQIYEARPMTCRTFPSTEWNRTCTQCGFSPPRQRRETKRLIRETILARRRAKLLHEGEMSRD